MFKLLDASSTQGRRDWLALWSAWPAREVCAHPSYAGLFAREGERAMCASFDSPGGCVLLPMIVRPLEALQWAGDLRGRCDWATPYGYGGPFVWGAAGPQALAAEFWREFDRWADAAGAVSGFMLQSPFPELLLPGGGEQKGTMPNIVRGLGLDGEAIWMSYEHKVRKNVKAARRAGLSVEVDLAGRRLADFLNVYHSTMERRNASTGYYFPRAFFERITQELAGQFAFFHVLKDARVVSTELVLASEQSLYSFLGGTLAQAFEFRPNELLKHTVIEWGRDNGKKHFVLGGGQSPRDGVFRYKQSFAPDGEVAVPLVLRVHDPAAYDALLTRRQAWENARSGVWNPRPDYYPAYRA